MIHNLVVIMLILTVANSVDKAPEPYWDLGEQLVESLRDGDIVSYAHCWLPVRRMNAIALASKKPIPKEKLKGMKVYFKKRNLQVAHSFKILCDLFKKQGKLKDLKLVDITIQGKIKERNGLRKITMFYVTVALGDVQYKISIDDGFEDGGVWYFSDKPLSVDGGPDSKHVSLLVEEDK